MGELKLYEFADADWIVARNLREAIRCWKSYSGATIRDALENFREVPRERWKKLTFIYDVYAQESKKTDFETRINEVINNGEETVPFFLASSEW